MGKQSRHYTVQSGEEEMNKFNDDFKFQSFEINKIKFEEYKEKKPKTNKNKNNIFQEIVTFPNS
jgi:ribosomal protein S17E